MTSQTSRKKWIFRVALILLIAVVLGVGSMLGGKRPDNLGLKDGQLAPCPDKPNCVSTQAKDESKHIAPLAISGESNALIEKVRTVLESWPRTQIITDDDGYFHAECTSAICRFTDDLEIWVDSTASLVHARSASRVGYSDLGVNRKRVEKLFAELDE